VAQDGVALLSLWREAETVPGHTGDLQSIDRLMHHDSNAVIVAEVDGQSSARSSPAGTGGAVRSTGWRLRLRTVAKPLPIEQPEGAALVELLA
jgi:hypothetical protein